VCLISNKYNFIYLKTHRTGSTVTEKKLSSLSDEKYINGRQTNNKQPYLFNHSNARDIKDNLNKRGKEDYFNKYRKVACIRNPYSTILSQYGWHLVRKKTKLNFKDFFISEIKSTSISDSKKVYSNIVELVADQYKNKLYIEDNYILTDIIRYENLENDINNFLHTVGYNKKLVPLPNLTTQRSPFNSDDYRKKYNEEMIEMIENHDFFKKYMEMFNYKF